MNHINDIHLFEPAGEYFPMEQLIWIAHTHTSKRLDPTRRRGGASSPQFRAGYTNSSPLVLASEPVHAGAQRNFLDEFSCFQGLLPLDDSILSDPKFRLNIPDALTAAMRNFGSADARQNAPLDAAAPNLMTRDNLRNLMRLDRDDHVIIFTLNDVQNGLHKSAPYETFEIDELVGKEKHPSLNSFRTIINYTPSPRTNQTRDWPVKFTENNHQLKSILLTTSSFAPPILKHEQRNALMIMNALTRTNCFSLGQLNGNANLQRPLCAVYPDRLVSVATDSPVIHTVLGNPLNSVANINRYCVGVASTVNTEAILTYRPQHKAAAESHIDLAREVLREILRAGKGKPTNRRDRTYKRKLEVEDPKDEKEAKKAKVESEDKDMAPKVTLTITDTPPLILNFIF